MSRTIAVRRSALRVWLIALAAAPFWVFGVDLIFQQRLLTRLAEIVYPGDVPAFEARDSLWAWLFLIVGISVTIWAIKELLVPRRMVAADSEGLALAVAGPFRRPMRLEWGQVAEVKADRAVDEGDVLPVLSVKTSGPGLIPEPLWGARKSDPQTMLMLASDWDRPVDEVANELRLLQAEARRGVVSPREGE